MVSESIKQVYEKFRSTAEQMRQLDQEIGDGAGTPEQQQRWDRLYADNSAADKQLQRHHALKGIDDDDRDGGLDTLRKGETRQQLANRQRFAALKPDEREFIQDMAIRSWCLGSHLASPEMKRAADLCNLSMTRPYVDVMPPAAKMRADYEAALGTGTEGGASVPVGHLPQLFEMLETIAEIRTIARIINTTGGNKIDITVVDPSANSAAIVDEEATGSFVVADVDKKTFQTWKFGAQARWSVELAQDTAVPFLEFIARDLGQQQGKGQATQFAVGDGTTEPEGYITAIDANTNAEITYDEVASPLTTSANVYGHLIDLEHGLNRAYRRRATMVMNDAILKLIRKAVDSNGQPIWRVTDGIRTGVPATINGNPYIIDDNMASSEGAGTIVIAYGDFSYYGIRQMPMRLVRANELFAASDQQAIFSWHRVDGKTLTQTDWANPPIVGLQGTP